MKFPLYRFTSQTRHFFKISFIIIPLCWSVWNTVKSALRKPESKNSITKFWVSFLFVRKVKYVTGLKSSDGKIISSIIVVIMLRDVLNLYLLLELDHKFYFHNVYFTEVLFIRYLMSRYCHRQFKCLLRYLIKFVIRHTLNILANTSL